MYTNNNARIELGHENGSRKKKFMGFDLNNACIVRIFFSF